MTGNRALRHACAALLVISPAACVNESPTVPTSAQVVVHAVLDPSSSVQEVLVEEANTGLPGLAGRCVRNAGVTITTPDGLAMRGVAQSLPPDALACSPYRVSLDAYGVRLRPGSTYALRVVTTDGREVTGTTTIPGGPPVGVSSVPMPFSIRLDTLRLDFTPVAGAAAYELRVSTPYSGYRRFVERPAVVPGLMKDFGGDYVFLGGRTNVTVAAVDFNYYEYYRTVSDPIGGGVLLTRLQGGVGVFGSIVVVDGRMLDVTF